MRKLTPLVVNEDAAQAARMIHDERNNKRNKWIHTANGFVVYFRYSYHRLHAGRFAFTLDLANIEAPVMGSGFTKCLLTNLVAQHKIAPFPTEIVYIENVISSSFAKHIRLDLGFNYVDRPGTLLSGESSLPSFWQTWEKLEEKFGTRII